MAPKCLLYFKVCNFCSRFHPEAPSCSFNMRAFDISPQVILICNFNLVESRDSFMNVHRRVVTTIKVKDALFGVGLFGRFVYFENESTT